MAAGSEGELVLTTLTKEALPLIRYRTGDLVSITSDPCRVRPDHGPADGAAAAAATTC